MQQFSTPMMRQYMEIKQKYMDCLLFFRMGDFYELFMEDAHLGAQVLNITLTSKAGGKDGKIPMAGVPYHAVDTYIAKLVKSGYKVAICEQLSPPNKKGIVKRDVVRVVTPGTLLDEHILDKKENNYLIAINRFSTGISFAVADLSTGYFAASEIYTDHFQKVIRDELARLKPSECLLPEELYNDSEILKLISSEKGINIYPYANWEEKEINSQKILKNHFGIQTLEGFAIYDKPHAIKSAAVLLSYLQETQKGAITHFKKLTSLTSEDGLKLDRATIINLELFSTIREHDVKGSLYSVLDNTITAMGGRMLKSWIKQPLNNKERIEERLDVVTLLNQKPELRDSIRIQLQQIPDIERLFARLSVGLGNARDLVNLKTALVAILKTKESVSQHETSLVKKLLKHIHTSIQDAITRIDTVIANEPPISVKDGGMIRDGINTDLDSLKKTIAKSKDWIMELERSEKERTKINSLKVKFNKVFGFYIEISKTNLHLVPDNYLRKQTLVNGERFITEELKFHEEIILTAEEKINELEYKIFLETIEYILTFTNHIQNAAQSIATIDCLTSFSYLAEKNRYTRPTLLYSGEIRIKEGRHPVVEKLLDDHQFVPNDVALDNITQSLLLITGPNMAGKSVFIRQVALIVLMAQLGCFVPAKSARISIADQIFVRSGASDVITSGLSTFMVEMVETAHILNNATKDSLIVMDEIGRGTSTYDGISIAWAVAEYLVKSYTPSPKVLFATHYHELQTLESEYPNQIKNFHMAVTDDKGEPVFLHTILPGGASHSFGVAVAKLAGIPVDVINRAKELLEMLEKRHKSVVTEQESNERFIIPKSYQNTVLIDHMMHKELASLDVATMTPLAALNKLAELKEKLKLSQPQSNPFIEAD